MPACTASWTSRGPDLTGPESLKHAALRVEVEGVRRGPRVLASRLPWAHLVRSWVAWALVLTVGLGALVTTVVAMERQLYTEALDTLRTQGQLIAEDTVGVSGSSVPLTPDAQEHLRAHVDRLRESGHLIGLQVWTSGGALVFAYPEAAVVAAPHDAPRVRVGRDTIELDSKHGTFRSDDVLTRLTVGKSAIMVVAMLPPSAFKEILLRGELRLMALAVVSLVAFTVVWVSLRRRTLAREREARRDPLTGLGNRIRLTEAINRLGERPFALVMLDLCAFKEVNDTLGHAAGDSVLTSVAGTLKGSVRPGDLVVRHAGDEFAILLADVEDPDRAVGIAEHLCERLSNAHPTVGGVTLDIRANCGVTLGRGGHTDAATALREADVAMYGARNAGIRVGRYDPDHDDHDADRLALLAQLRQAIAHEGLALHYQPIVTAASGAHRGAAGVAIGPNERVNVVEALVRWDHPARGRIPPDVFVPLAEHTDLIGPLTTWILEHAIAQASSWQDSDLDMGVAINLSPRALRHELTAQVLTLLHHHHLSADRLTLEVTETAIAADPAEATATLSTLSAAGISISLDDFGSGYTSISHLTDLPVSELKIDRSLASAVTQRAEQATVVASIIDLGHRLGLTITAEGIEDTPTRDLLLGLGCDSIQGYLYSPALPPHQLEGWLTSHAYPGIVTGG